jgi:hypothetical protein
MPPRRKPRESNSHERDPNADTPTLQDDADILAEAGAEPDEETGELAVDGDTVRELGAVDATSVRENRRLSRVVQKKREGKKDVPFNTKDVVVIYGTLLQYWTPDSIDITAKRMLGGATTMLNKPINGAALYDAIMHFHGQHAEAEYEIKFTSSGKYLGMGRITMPNTLPATQQGQPMQQPYYPPNGVHPQPQQPWQPPAAQPQAPQAIPPTSDPVAMLRQVLDMVQTISRPQQPAVPAPAPQQVTLPQITSTDPVEMLRQVLEMVRQTQGAAVPPPVVQPAPVVMPPTAPQPGPLDQIAVLRELLTLVREMQPPPPPPQRQAPRAFDPNGDREGERPPYARPAYEPPQPPQRPPTMAETFRESISVVRSAVDMMQEMEGVLPGREAQETSASPEDDDSPVRVIDTGHAKIVVNKSDGSTRLWETGVANMDKIFKWVGEQREAIQKESATRQRSQREQQQLPLGFVEVEPGYRSPPRYVAVPIDQDDLPPPPEHVPPPIRSEPRAPWGAPPTSSDEQEQ